MPALLARVAVISGIRAMAAIRRGPALRERRAAPRGNTAHEPARSGSALIKEFRRLKADENDRLQLDWNLQRTLVERGQPVLHIHADGQAAPLPPALGGGVSEARLGRR